MHAAAAQNTKHCRAAECGCSMCGCRTILFRLQAMPTRRCLKTLGRTSAENHMPTSVRRILSHAETQAAASQHLMQTAAQGLAAAAEHACGLYRRRHGNCTQTFTDRLSGCGYRERSRGRLPVNRKGIVGPVLGTQPFGRELRS